MLKLLTEKVTSMEEKQMKMLEIQEQQEKAKEKPAVEVQVKADPKKGPKNSIFFF